MHEIQAITIRSCPEFRLVVFSLKNALKRTQTKNSKSHQMQATAIQFKSFRSTGKNVVLYPSWIH